MVKSNIASISSRVSKPDSITLNEVMVALQNWRKNRVNPSERIPSSIWDNIFILLNTTSESKIRKATGISSTQFRKAHEKYNVPTSQSIDKQSSTNKKHEQIDFCEVTPPKSPLSYKPAEAFTTTTSVVELYRPDGILMKLHFTTDRFAELLRAFFYE
jgi:hypothetical protein